MAEPLVVATSVRRWYGTGDSRVYALREATCTIYPTDRIALIGPSGSGKSTLLHLLGGIDVPTEGAVVWPGLGERDSLRPHSVVDIFQGPSLLPPLTAIENVRLPLLLIGGHKDDATRDASVALERFGLLDLADKLPEELSGGQAQRVGIARAIVVKPRLILADEPTGQLDSVTASSVLTILFDVIAELGAAIVLSTHDRSVAERLDTIWAMKNGHLTPNPHSTDLASPGALLSNNRPYAVAHVETRANE